MSFPLPAEPEGREMRFLVFQHVDVEHPGSFREFMRSDGIAWDTVELDAGEPIPGLAGYDALPVMGGPMDAWEDDLYPWMAPEKQAIRAWVDSGRPFLGICLGHQLLAAALGGRVGPMATPEVGICPVTLHRAAAGDRLFEGLSSPLSCLQWHGSEVRQLPDGAVLLAGNEACRVQSFRAGDKAYGIQFHVEVTPATVPSWGAIPAYAAALEKALGAGAQARLQAAASAHMDTFVAAARTVYGNFTSLL